MLTKETSAAADCLAMTDVFLCVLHGHILTGESPECGDSIKRTAMAGHPAVRLGLKEAGGKPLHIGILWQVSL